MGSSRGPPSPHHSRPAKHLCLLSSPDMQCRRLTGKKRARTIAPDSSGSKEWQCPILLAGITQYGAGKYLESGEPYLQWTSSCCPAPAGISRLDACSDKPVAGSPSVSHTPRPQDAGPDRLPLRERRCLARSYPQSCFLQAMQTNSPSRAPICASGCGSSVFWPPPWAPSDARCQFLAGTGPLDDLPLVRRRNRRLLAPPQAAATLPLIQYVRLLKHHQSANSHA